MRRGRAAPRLLALMLFAAAGCSSSEAAVPSRVSNEHGVGTGDRIRATKVSCSDGRTREIGGAGTVQAVTFATPYDCALCNEHLAGLLAKPLSDSPGVDAFAVVWSPKMSSLERDMGEFGSKYPVCFDTSGGLWDAYSIAHTPFTAVLRQGRVSYINDRPLTTPPAVEQFVSDVRQSAAAP